MRLEGEAVGDAKFLPHDNPGCGLFRFLDCKVAVSKVEDVTVLVDEAGEDLLFEAVIHAARVPVHEDVLLPRVAVQVAHQEYVPVLLQLLYQHFGVVDGGVQLPGWVDPAPIEVHSRQVAPRTPIDHPVHIQHRHYLEHKVVPQNLRIQRRTSQIVDDAFHHPRGAGLSRVHTRGQHHPFPMLDCLWVALECSDYDHVAVVAGDGLAEGA
eukprot:CAMPEP_0202964870 /NCGR_PEP_ID=MMETSP1396-20130829/8991_1 /ASSEMBLY_ACC=CAM_ASM_000872 /TAXON_ID= /ORGANISM="Pseudokeronopsis sp., Strain Brazil" /LENGTH=209 /DNA_ID=CAMNT_0049687339 /DNA_START=279 /DNA_END=906 /DNA_ORIENTATION=+